MNEFFEKHLKVYGHEFAAFLWTASLFLTIFFVTAIFRNYVDTAFLKRYGPEYIPYMLVISAILTVVVLGFADRIARRLSDAHLMIGFLGLYSAASVGCFLLVKADVSIVYPVLYQLLGLLDSILIVYLWNMAGDLFDARQGKRVFPLITAAQVLGTTIGSFLTRPITAQIGEDAALLIFAVVFLGAAIYLAGTRSRFFGEPEPRATAVKKEPDRKKLSEIPGLMRQFPIVRYLIITGLLPNILLPIFSYQFSLIAAQTFQSEQSLITFLSLFRGTTTLATFVILMFAGRLYSRIGLPNASMVHPINFSILFAGLVAFFNIYVACYGQFTVILIQRAVAGPVNKILYSVVPRALQAWSRYFIRGTVLKIGMFIGSLTMIALKPVLDPQDFAYIALAVAVYWIFETVLFRKEYSRILKQVIVEDDIDFDQIEAVRAFDAGGAPIGLESDVGQVVRTDETREPAKAERPRIEAALQLLDDPSSQVRADAASTFAETPDMRAAAKLIRLLQDLNEPVRDAAMGALIKYPGDILPFLEASLPEADLRGKQAILEIIRLSPNISEFEMAHLLGRSVEEAYGNLLVIRRLQNLPETTGTTMLNEHLRSRNGEILRLLFYALWVYYDDMRLMYDALSSEKASVAVEMVETSIRGKNLPYIIPLIDEIPIDEKIATGRKLFNLVSDDSTERLLTYLAASNDRVTRMLTVYAMGDLMPNPVYVPIVEARREDPDPFVREAANYASARCSGKEAPMPDVIDTINCLKRFELFENLGPRELHAVASVVKRERYPKGEVLIRAGEENSSIYLTLSGRIVVYADYGTADQKEVRSLGADDYLNFGPNFSNLPPINTSVVIEDAEVLVLQQSRFHEICRVYPQIALNLLKIAAVKMRELGFSA